MSLLPAVQRFIHDVPKVELHLHLVGSASPATVSRLAERHGSAVVPVDESALRSFFEFTDFLHFIEVYITPFSHLFAGEADGPASVWAALGYLRADRIGHGVRSIEDPRLVAHLVDRKIPLEVCPSSNVCTRAYSSLREHPVEALMDAGVIVTLNTDDPPMFSTTLNEEYARVADTFDLTVADVAGLVRNAVRSSFLDPARVRRLLDEIDAVAARHAS